MLMEQATEVRKQWSAACDSVVRDKPMFIKRTRDKMWFSNLETMAEILEAYQFHANLFVEDDGTVTLSLHEIDLIENGHDEQESRFLLGKSILEYSVEYYNNYEMYSHSPNRRGHIPYIFKALINDNPAQIGGSIICQDGKN